jgi:hypothetical protein
VLPLMLVVRGCMRPAYMRQAPLLSPSICTLT